MQHGQRFTQRKLGWQWRDGGGQQRNGGARGQKEKPSRRGGKENLRGRCIVQGTKLRIRKKRKMLRGFMSLQNKEGGGPRKKIWGEKGGKPPVRQRKGTGGTLTANRPPRGQLAVKGVWGQGGRFSRSRFWRGRIFRGQIMSAQKLSIAGEIATLRRVGGRGAVAKKKR